MTFKKITILLLIITFVFTGFACSNQEEAVAEVNDQSITLDQFNQYFSIYALEKQGVDEDTLKNEVLDEMVEMEVVKQYMIENGIEVNNDEINKSFDDYMNFVNQNEEAKKFMTDNNLTEDFIKEIFTNQYFASKFFEEITEDIEDTDAAVQAYYEKNKEKFRIQEVQASHILVDSEKEAEDILVKINEGDDFAELAKEFSTCPSAEKGGDLGVFVKGQMVKEFEDAAFALEVGEISDIVKTDFGFHIIKLVDKKNELKTLEEVHEYAKSLMYEERYKAKVKEIMDTMDVKKYTEQLS